MNYSKPGSCELSTKRVRLKESSRSRTLTFHISVISEEEEEEKSLVTLDLRKRRKCRDRKVLQAREALTFHSFRQDAGYPSCTWWPCT